MYGGKRNFKLFLNSWANYEKLKILSLSCNEEFKLWKKSLKVRKSSQKMMLKHDQYI